MTEGRAFTSLRSLVELAYFPSVSGCIQKTSHQILMENKVRHVAFLSLSISLSICRFLAARVMEKGSVNLCGCSGWVPRRRTPRWPPRRASRRYASAPRRPPRLAGARSWPSRRRLEIPATAGINIFACSKSWRRITSKLVQCFLRLLRHV